jgi:UPF0042 nucleotide-binding protein
MSGAGKSLALKYLEDIGYYCVDNLPAPLIDGLINVCSGMGGVERAAVGVDIRGGRLFNEWKSDMRAAKRHGEILFLDCADDVLLKRYKETRREHPLAIGGRVEDGIRTEREMLATIKENANFVIDTTGSLTKQLKEKINGNFAGGGHKLTVNIVSFGFKYGMPNDSDMVFDVRFIPNPFYDPTLRELTGNDAPVREYVLSFPTSLSFLDKLKDMAVFLLPNFIDEGKSQLVLSIGCTGGRHRSVTLSNELFGYLCAQGYKCVLTHRDIGK